jgi:hypothetical protein
MKTKGKNRRMATEVIGGTYVYNNENVKMSCP